MLTRPCVVLFASLVVATGCYRQAPDKGQAERLQRLETRVAELEALDARLTEVTQRIEAMTQALSQLGDIGVAIEDRELEGKLGQLDEKLEELERKRRAGPPPVAPSPPVPRPGRPSPTAVYAVPVAGSPYVGPRYAKITIIKAFEFACPFCHKSRATIDQLIKDYGSDVRVVYKHLIVHPQVANTPAYAACAADLQGSWEAMMNLIWDKGFNAGRDLSQQNMERLAGELGLDIGRLRADMAGKCVKVVAEDQALMNKFGVTGTPGFFINGRFLSGAQPVQAFKTIIDEELDKANDRLRRGTRPRDYYDKWVIAKGDPPIN
ncbi:MAG TPA: DsbA family protein [Kofleriaceae bacterium]|nr:DsbA family protein [Kofleriaceae bacterium]